MCIRDSIQIVQMGLEERRLREAGELAQRQTADELHLRVLGSIGAVLVQNGCCRRILQNVLYLAVERKCHNE